MLEMLQKSKPTYTNSPVREALNTTKLLIVSTTKAMAHDVKAINKALAGEKQ